MSSGVGGFAEGIPETVPETFIGNEAVTTANSTAGSEGAVHLTDHPVPPDDNAPRNQLNSYHRELKQYSIECLDGCGEVSAG